MLSMHESRKSVSSASVIWYTILFRQNRTDRPIKLFECRVDLPGQFGHSCKDIFWRLAINEHVVSF